MLNRIILLLPFLCLVASKPQETPLAVTYGGKQYLALLDKPAVVPATPPNECDGYSCNGIEYKVVTNNTDLFLGQCQTPLPDAGNDTFCFVNEDSACEKTKMDQFQGKYISTEPCQAINSPKKRGWNWKTGFFACLLGSTQILMADYSTKAIEDLKSGEFILDGHLHPIEVVEVFSNHVGANQMFQFAPNGPVFTEDHQFLSNLDQGHAGVVSKKALFSQSPQLEESNTIHNLDEMESLLQFKDGNIILAGFDVVPYHALDPSTRTYFIITKGQDGSYIADNFVSRDIMPDFEKWPLTYATLGYILTSCEIDYPIDSHQAAAQLAHDTQDLTENWRHAILNFETLETLDDFMFDHSTWIQLGQQEILKDKKKMKFAQKLDAFGAKLLHQVLDDNNLPLGKRHALIRKIINITQQSFVCNFVDLP